VASWRTMASELADHAAAGLSICSHLLMDSFCQTCNHEIASCSPTTYSDPQPPRSQLSHRPRCIVRFLEMPAPILVVLTLHPAMPIGLDIVRRRTLLILLNKTRETPSIKRHLFSPTMKEFAEQKRIDLFSEASVECDTEAETTGEAARMRSRKEE
jgi:hypothetical protein